MVSHNGTAGHTAATDPGVQLPGAAGIRHRDVLGRPGTHWDLSPYPGLHAAIGAASIAGVLYRDFSRRRDDVTVVVAKERPPVAEKL